MNYVEYTFFSLCKETSMRVTCNWQTSRIYIKVNKNEKYNILVRSFMVCLDSFHPYYFTLGYFNLIVIISILS